jgi:hypothetical protein
MQEKTSSKEVGMHIGDSYGGRNISKKRLRYRDVTSESSKEARCVRMKAMSHGGTMRIPAMHRNDRKLASRTAKGVTGKCAAV